MIQHRLQTIADEFWSRAGQSEPFPRMLEDALTWALPLSVIQLPQLNTRKVQSWLLQREIRLTLATPTRALHACVVAFRGTGFIFLDSEDDDSERRFSTAHEIGHFLLDYWERRQLAISRFGPSIEDVIDGFRTATVEERVHSLLADVQITPFTHLMERRPDGQLGCDSLQKAELQADSLALELLAPYETVKNRLSPGTRPDDKNFLIEILVTDFGLPSQVAQKYLKAFQSQEADRGSVRKWLGM